MEKMTKAQQLVEIANWVKHQNPEFTKHFKSMKSILRVYRELPTDYDKKKSIAAYITKGMKSTNYSVRQKSERIALIFNTLFCIRYFKDAPHRFVLRLSLHRWKHRDGKETLEVRCNTYDRCNIYDGFKPYEHAASLITIKNIGDAKRAAEQLVSSEANSCGEDYEIQYSQNIKEAMKEDKPSNEILTEGIEVII